MTRHGVAFMLATLATCFGSFGLASAADAQRPESPWHIGVLLGGLSPESKEAQAFRQGLLDAGYGGTLNDDHVDLAPDQIGRVAGR